MSIVASNGADDDWHAIVQEHEPGLRRYIGRRMANRHLVDDALQETYLRAMRSPNPLDGRWLRVLARQASVDVYRREPPPGPETDPLSLVAEWAAADGELPGSDEHVAAIASRQAVRWAFARLSPRHQRLLLLRGVHELTYDEIAAAEGVTPEALTSALNRARERLRAGMRAYEGGGLAAVAGFGARWRLRLARAQATIGSLPVSELAGVGLAVGIVTMSQPVSQQRTDAAAAAERPAPTPSAAELRLAEPAAASSPAHVAPPLPPSGGARPAPRTNGTRVPVADATTDVTLTPEAADVRVVVDSATVTGTRTARVTATFTCAGSVLLGPTCPIYENL